MHPVREGRTCVEDLREFSGVMARFCILLRLWMTQMETCASCTRRDSYRVQSCYLLPGQAPPVFTLSFPSQEATCKECHPNNKNSMTHRGILGRGNLFLPIATQHRTGYPHTLTLQTNGCTTMLLSDSFLLWKKTWVLTCTRMMCSHI